MEPASAAGPDGERGGGGVLSYLERLEMQASLSHEKSGKLQRAQAEANALRTKIQKLRQLRDELKAEVTRRQALVQAATASLEPDQTVGMSEQEVLERRWENAKAILQAYRFTGLSGQLTSRGVCVHIDTAFEDHLLDSYFVDLVLQKPLRIRHHSVPAFIPLEKMAAQHLQTDIQHFLFALCQHLNAYAGRKYQADRLQDGFAALLTGPLQRNSLCSVLSFTYKVDSGAQCVPFSARLLYRDLTGTLPTDVTIACLGAEGLPISWERRRAAHRTLFSMKPLHKVFASFARGEKLDLSLTS
ncbi:centromere protein O isoform X1 [Ochotona princeps]|uniref:centromere protein O isoform X1 n=1 Tax=Ochotona princeps TaxID=9978 RepID=UPI00271530AD|nr:centromere protein O isoform X1 [Ochotona princeps]